MSEPTEHTSEHLKAPKGFEVKNNALGERAATLLTHIMRGTDPTTAVATLTAGMSGHAAERVAAISDMRSELLTLRLKNIESNRDENGQNPLERFQRSFGERIAEKLTANTKEAERRRLAFHAELFTELLDEPNDELLQKHMQQLFDGKIAQPPSLSFVTDYHGVKYDSRGNYVNDNQLLAEAIDEAASNEYGEVDERIADDLDGLLPTKMGLSVEPGGAIRIFIDGRELVAEEPEA